MVEKIAKHGRHATSRAKLGTHVLSPVGPENFSEHYYGVRITSTPLGRLRGLFREWFLVPPDFHPAIPVCIYGHGVEPKRIAAAINRYAREAEWERRPTLRQIIDGIDERWISGTMTNSETGLVVYARLCLRFEERIRGAVPVTIIAPEPETMTVGASGGALVNPGVDN